MPVRLDMYLATKFVVGIALGRAGRRDIPATTPFSPSLVSDLHLNVSKAGNIFCSMTVEKIVSCCASKSPEELQHVDAQEELMLHRSHNPHILICYQHHQPARGNDSQCRKKKLTANSNQEMPQSEASSSSKSGGHLSAWSRNVTAFATFAP